MQLCDGDFKSRRVLCQFFDLHPLNLDSDSFFVLFKLLTDENSEIRTNIGVVLTRKWNIGTVKVRIVDFSL